MRGSTLRLLAALVLLSVLPACDPPEPRAKVQKPFPADSESSEPAADPESEVRRDGPPTRADLVASVPVSVAAIELRHRELVRQLEASEEALLALEAELIVAETPDQHQRLQARAGELREASRQLAVEARALRSEAAQLHDTSVRLKAIVGAGE